MAVGQLWLWCDSDGAVMAVGQLCLWCDSVMGQLSLWCDSVMEHISWPTVYDVPGVSSQNEYF